jgi:hypothetical protein
MENDTMKDALPQVNVVVIVLPLMFSFNVSVIICFIFVTVIGRHAPISPILTYC